MTASFRGRVRRDFDSNEWGGGGATISGGDSLGITSLAFTADDKALVAHGPYEARKYRFSMWRLTWNEGELDSFFKRWEKEDKGPFLHPAGQNLRFITRADGTDGGYKRLLVRGGEHVGVFNINSQKTEQKIPFLKTQHGQPEFATTRDDRWIIMGDDNGMAYVYDTLRNRRYSVTIDDKMEAHVNDRRRSIKSLNERPAHSGPIVGVALSDPDPGQDHPAYAATIGEENKLKVWELFPILNSETGVRSRK